MKRVVRLACALGVTLTAACSPDGHTRSVAPRSGSPDGIGPATPPDRGDPLAFLRSTLVPYPGPADRGRLALTDPIAKRIATYDSALVVLVLIRRGTRDEAARIIEGLLALQRPDGSLPFSFPLPRPDGSLPYIRSGALAWVGYAAAEYLDADRAGPARGEALTLARGVATYLLGRQITKAGDPRDGLVRGGEGALRYELDAGGELRERLEADDIAWTSVEHNVDSFFFFRALARVTAEPRYAEAATRIARALAATWSGSLGQLRRGVAATGPDEIAMLDCASWGSIFLGATGDRDRADTAAAVADASYGTRDPRTGAHGHRAQRRGPLVEGALLQRVLGAKLPARDWSELDIVWPEGSAGVALAAWRSGRVTRAKEIVAALEPLRAANGSLPTSTVEIPFVFDTRPSIAGTAWIELVKFELARAPGHPTFWVP